MTNWFYYRGANSPKKKQPPNECRSHFGYCHIKFETRLYPLKNFMGVKCAMSQMTVQAFLLVTRPEVKLKAHSLKACAVIVLVNVGKCRTMSFETTKLTQASFSSTEHHITLPYISSPFLVN